MSDPTPNHFCLSYILAVACSTSLQVHETATKQISRTISKPGFWIKMKELKFQFQKHQRTINFPVHYLNLKYLGCPPKKKTTMNEGARITKNPPRCQTAQNPALGFNVLLAFRDFWKTSLKSKWMCWLEETAVLRSTTLCVCVCVWVVALWIGARVC